MVDRVPLDELAGLRSTEADPGRQPDPVILQGLVASLRAFQDEAGRLGVPDDFLRTMIEGFVECFRRLDGLPRDDPFCEATNRRPTRYKMGDFCRKLAEDAHEDGQALLMQEAVQVLVGHYFDPTTWRRLISCGRAEAAVIVWMRHRTTGYDGMAIPRVKGKRREVRRALARRSQELLGRYRRGERVGEECPLKRALAADGRGGMMAGGTGDGDGGI